MKPLSTTTRRTVSEKLFVEGYTIRPMNVGDLPEVRELVLSTEGLAFQPWEDINCLQRAIERNVELSQVAFDWKVNQGRPQMVGCVLLGEGVMAMVHHLAVMPKARGGGRQLGTHLVRFGLKRLYHTPNAAKRLYITTLKSNTVAQKFWSKFGADFQSDGDLCLFTMNLDPARHPWLEE